MKQTFITLAVLATAVFANGPGFKSNSKYYGLQSEDGLVHFQDLKSVSKQDDGMLSKAF